MTLQTKNVLITGAYGGLGAALARKYFLAGNNLCLVGRNEKKLLALKDELQSLSSDGEVLLEACNLNDVESLVSLTQRVDNVDVLINCAGVFPVASLEDTDSETFLNCINTNLVAPFILIREFSKSMKRNGWGRIINIASSSAYAGSPKTSAYCASKHALLGLSRSLYKELKGHGVRVFTVSPGSIQTEMGKDVEKLGQLYDTFMTPEEVSDYIHYVTSFDGHMVSEEIRLNRMIVQ